MVKCPYEYLSIFQLSVFDLNKCHFLSQEDLPKSQSEIKMKPTLFYQDLLFSAPPFQPVI